ncbi:MAG: AAA family ATPase, partial [Pseudonocardiaceae bacterium]
RLPLGLGGDTLATLELDLSTETAALIAGPAGSGKTTALAALADAALKQRIPVFAIGALETLPGTAVVDIETLRSLSASAEPSLVLVDDVEPLAGSEIDTALGELLRVRRHRVVLAGGSEELIGIFRGCVTEARRRRTGLLLAPRPGDGEIFGQARLTREVADQAGTPGRGLLIQHGTATPLQLVAPAASGPATQQRFQEASAG